MEDMEFMKLAIAEARKSVPEDDGRTHPLVGVVVAKGKEELARAHRGELSPGDHAEFAALEKKLPKEAVAGATVYTTLEPCTTRNHPKIPCAARLVERKVARVVIGMFDPNPDIDNRGVIALQRAGIEIDLFPPELASEIQEINREFIRDQGFPILADPLTPIERLGRIPHRESDGTEEESYPPGGYYYAVPVGLQTRKYAGGLEEYDYLYPCLPGGGGPVGSPVYHDDGTALVPSSARLFGLEPLTESQLRRQCERRGIAYDELTARANPWDGYTLEDLNPFREELLRERLLRDAGFSTVASGLGAISKRGLDLRVVYQNNEGETRIVLVNGYRRYYQEGRNPLADLARAVVAKIEWQALKEDD